MARKRVESPSDGSTHTASKHPRTVLMNRGNQDVIPRMAADEQGVERIAGIPSKTCPLAPPELEDADLAMVFTDKDGGQHHVKIRGTRSVGGVYFSVNGIASAFQRRI